MNEDIKHTCILPQVFISGLVVIMIIFTTKLKVKYTTLQRKMYLYLLSFNDQKIYLQDDI